MRVSSCSFNMAGRFFLRRRLLIWRNVQNCKKLNGFQVSGTLTTYLLFRREPNHAISSGVTLFVPYKMFATMATRKCWKCTKDCENALFVCEHCGTVQSVDYNLNYFKVFDLEPNFKIDNGELTKRFRSLQTQFHPDKFTGKLQLEQDLSAECSSFINTVYQTLAQPLQRAQYLLALSNADTAESSIEVDTEFLTEIMEKNELLVGEISSKELESIKLDNNAVMKNILEELSNAFDDNNLKKAKILLAKLKYYVNIDKKIKSLTLKLASDSLATEDK